MTFDRNLALVLIISLLSIVAGIAFYKLTIEQPEFITASTNVDATPHSSSDSPKPATVNFDNIVLNDLDSTPRYLTDWKKPVLIVNFWAPWCPPCLREIPALMDLQQTYPQRVQLIGLSFDSKKNVAEFKQKSTINYPLLLVQKESTMINNYFGNDTRALPFTAILNEKREIIFRHNGEITKAMLQAEVNALL